MSILTASATTIAGPAPARSALIGQQRGDPLLRRGELLLRLPAIGALLVEPAAQIAIVCSAVQSARPLCSRSGRAARSSRTSKPLFGASWQATIQRRRTRACSSAARSAKPPVRSRVPDIVPRRSRA